MTALYKLNIIYKLLVFLNFVIDYSIISVSNYGGTFRDVLVVSIESHYRIFFVEEVLMSKLMSFY